MLKGIGIALLVGSLVLAGCGGSSSKKAVNDGVGTTATPTTTPSSGRVALTAQACNTLGSIISDLQRFGATGGGFDYPKDVAAMDNFADNVEVPGEVAGSVETFRKWLDRFASAAQDVGLTPNNDPLPDQLDKLQSELGNASADESRATQALYTWVGNDCS